MVMKYNFFFRLVVIACYGIDTDIYTAAQICDHSYREKGSGAEKWHRLIERKEANVQRYQNQLNKANKRHEQFPPNPA
jgi:hypothetical protein